VQYGVVEQQTSEVSETSEVMDEMAAD
jgi:hypothetical protein